MKITNAHTADLGLGFVILRSGQSCTVPEKYEDKIRASVSFKSGLILEGEGRVIAPTVVPNAPPPPTEIRNMAPVEALAFINASEDRTALSTAMIGETRVDVRDALSTRLDTLIQRSRLGPPGPAHDPAPGPSNPFGVSGAPNMPNPFGPR